MPQTTSERWADPQGDRWNNAGAALNTWVAGLAANIDKITAWITHYTEWAAAAASAMETTAERLTAEQLASIKADVDTIHAAYPHENWIRAAIHAARSLEPYPTLRRLLPQRRRYQLQARFGEGVKVAVTVVVAHGVQSQGEQRYVELLTRPWRAAGLAVPAPRMGDLNG